MRSAAFTVDVDSDVNLPARGRRECISQGSDCARFSSCQEGLVLIVSLLNELEIPATFFLESRAAQSINSSIDLAGLLQGHEIAYHSLAHEDLTGQDSGEVIPSIEIERILKEGLEIIDDELGVNPIGFRAPYLHINDSILDILSDEGFCYDSSLVREMEDGRIDPFPIKGNLTEVPIASGRDPQGKKMIAYLWPLHEGKRNVNDYVRLMSNFKEGLLVLATHSWHVVESYQGRFEENDARSGLEDVRAMLENAKNQGIKFTTIADFLEQEEV